MNSGEKWTAHIIVANISHAVTGWAMTLTTLEWSTGSSQRWRVSEELKRRTSVIGAASASSGAATSINSTCWTMWTENSVVS